MPATASLPVLKPDDFKSDQEVRWCPRCGDYSILAQVLKVLPTLGIPTEKFMFVSGLACSSRFPYYLSTYGFHGIHGLEPALASGIKITRPDLQVWLVTGDGDGLSIGGNHLLHVIRRNMDVKILLFNNQIYGLTKGQYSPTSPLGKKSYSTPMGSVDNPISPLAFALGCEATFVARTVDLDTQHMVKVLERAAAHKGSAFVEIYQDCNVFNSGAFLYAEKRDERPENLVYLEHGKPLIYGKDKKKAIRIDKQSLKPEVVDVGAVPQDDLLFHDEKNEDPAVAFMLARMRRPQFPEPVGILRAIERPTYDGMTNDQSDESIK